MIYTTWETIEHHLPTLAEEGYYKFSQKLIPDTPEMYGIRQPLLKKMAKDIVKANPLAFLATEKSSVHEVILLECYVLSLLKLHPGELIPLIEKQLPKLYNWSQCDTLGYGLKQIKSNPSAFLPKIKEWCFHENPWICRTALVLLLTFYIDEDYLETSLSFCEQIHRPEYYIQMAQAWLISIAYCKDAKTTCDYIYNSQLESWIINKSIQKIRESNRVSLEEKQYICSYKRK